MQAPKVDDDADIVAVIEFLQDRLDWAKNLTTEDVPPVCMRDIRKAANILSKELQIVFDEIGM